MRVLIVEDEGAVRELLCPLLEDDGCRVVQVETGQQAVECCRRDSFSLVILDRRMPRS